MTGSRADIYEVVYKIPKGKVATYGQVAALAGFKATEARQVGYALAALSEHSAIPWHRVINAKGTIALKGGPDATQRIRLEKEGVKFGAGGKIDLKRFGWTPEEESA